MSDAVFDKIAAGWYGFRHHSIFSSELEALAGRWQGGRLLNLGCGHGADFLPFARFQGNTKDINEQPDGFDLYGIDFSIEMLKMAVKYARKYNFAPSLVLADMQAIPFGNNSFDYVIAVASIHHIKGREAQIRVLSELKRVLKPGGEAFVTVWNRCQPRFWFKSKDVLVPWHSKNETVYRYYHLFSFGELEWLVRKAGLKVVSSFTEKSYRFPLKHFARNICLLIKKEE